MSPRDNAHRRKWRDVRLISCVYPFTVRVSESFVLFCFLLALFVALF